MARVERQSGAYIYIQMHWHHKVIEKASIRGATLIIRNNSPLHVALERRRERHNALGWGLVAELDAHDELSAAHSLACMREGGEGGERRGRVTIMGQD